jgi:PKD repeat protein
LAQDALTGEIYGTPSYDVSNDDFSISIEASNWQMTAWQNWTLHITNIAPTFNSTPLSSIEIDATYTYDTETDAEYQIGSYSISTDYTLAYDFNTTSGLLTFTPLYIGVFTFEITIDDNSDAVNATTTQSWTITILPTDSGGGGAATLTANFMFELQPDESTVKFTDLSTGGDVAIWAWDFSDGKKSIEQNPVHVYKTIGTYQVKLTITDSSGKTSFIVKTVSTAQDASVPMIPFELVHIPIIVGIITGMLIAIFAERKYTRVIGVCLILASVTIFFGMIV